MRGSRLFVEHKFAVFANLGFRYLFREGNERWENLNETHGFESLVYVDPLPMMQTTIVWAIYNDLSPPLVTPNGDVVGESPQKWPEKSGQGFTINCSELCFLI